MGFGDADTVTFDELRQALRLVLELRELPRGSAAQQRRAVEGIAALVGAQAGADAGGEPRFTERERRLVELVHREASFLHEPPSALSPELLRGLSPRLRDALRGFARGLSEKQVAAELGISPHTAHDYAKALHRHFGVQSRSELLAHCLTGR
jgi:DNA-binding NarL/FixJ family response regulator